MRDLDRKVGIHCACAAIGVMCRAIRPAIVIKLHAVQRQAAAILAGAEQAVHACTLEAVYPHVAERQVACPELVDARLPRRNSAAGSDVYAVPYDAGTLVEIDGRLAERIVGRIALQQDNRPRVVLHHALYDDVVGRLRNTGRIVGGGAELRPDPGLVEWSGIDRRIDVEHVPGRP